VKTALIFISLICLSISIYLLFAIVGGYPTAENGLYILLSCFASLTVVSVGWWVSLYIAQRQSTLAIIAQSRMSDGYLNQISRFQDVFPRGEKLSFKTFMAPENQDARSGLLNVLNFLEFIAIGIKEKDLSESVCESFFSAVFTSQWYRCSEIIKHLQTYEDSRTFRNFEYFAKKWSKH